MSPADSRRSAKPPGRTMSAPETRTYKLVVAYDGARFKGWQRGNGRTVQSTLEEAIAESLADASGGAVATDAAVRVEGSGRTDAGVHAEGQVASVVLPAGADPRSLYNSVNRQLPPDLTLLSLEEADGRFHARYRATAKTYRYRVVDGPVGDPFLRRYSLRESTILDVERMQSAAVAFLGTHDFSSFTADRPKPNKERTVHSIEFARTGPSFARPLDILVRGDGFLWKQVRIMVSALAAAGKGEIDAARIEEILLARDRSLAPSPAPAHGLTLISVEYGAR